LIIRVFYIKYRSVKITSLNTLTLKAMTPFSEQIKQLRIERGYQQTQFALSVGISPCTKSLTPD